MRTALVILLICAAVDLVLCLLLIGVVWLEHRRQKRRAWELGESIPNAAMEFGCLIAFAVLGLLVLYGAAWFLFVA